MMNQRDKQRQETRARLISAGARVFSQDGLQGARIADIAREAEVAMGTLYSHFEDKDALFAEVIRTGNETVLQGLKAAQAAPLSPAERDLLAMNGVLAFAEVHSGMFRLLMGRGGPTNHLQGEVISAIAGLRVDELNRGQDEGWARSDLDPELAARCEIGSVFHLIDWWLANDKPVDRSVIIETLSQVRRYGTELPQKTDNKKPAG